MEVIDMRRRERGSFALQMGVQVALLGALALAAGAADTVPTDVQQPGTQPGEASQIQSVSKCDNCHGSFDPAGEPWFNWTGGLMSHASRDPLFWATMAIAEQDFDGSGDLCLRCHVPKGWLAGRSTPTDGSAMAEGDANGVQCDVCHRITNPDGSEHVGVQNTPFLAHDGGTPPTGFYGSGMYVIWNENSKLGPYVEADATHQFAQSQFHRSVDFCGTCHDVSNPVVGDLAHNNGAPIPLDAGSFSGVPGAPVQEKAAFKNAPYRYGVVERTFSEYKASLLSQTPVSDYESLPLELQDGAIQRARQAALLAGTGGDFAVEVPGTPPATRYFSCQTCHMRPTIGQGCNKNPRVRSDLGVHDQTGGNYWVPQAIQYLDGLGLLRLGGGLTASQVTAMDAGALRARQNLEDAASLSLVGNTLKVVNLTGHKLITGYPEGRRMWVHVQWYDGGGAPLAEDGAYGTILADIGGVPTAVETLLDLHPPYSRVYEAHGAMTQEWASQLLALGVPPALPLGYDRFTGQVDFTLGQLAAEPAGSYHETFHFVLNNAFSKDNRIPPYGMSYDDARVRNILPVPSGQYGDPGVGGTFEHWDELALNPPPGADHATVSLLYQPTSWEYIQFLDLANTGAVVFLANEGANLLDAWLNTGMAAPHTMAALSWTNVVSACSDGIDNDRDGLTDHAGGDPGCASPTDESEDALGIACDDRLDNDGDGLIDYPDDPGCSGPAATSEQPDQDGDGVGDDADNCLVEANPSQLDTNLDGFGNACDADYTDDALVGAPDFLIFGPAFGSQTGEPAYDEDVDADGDGVIGLAEFLLIGQSFGGPPGPSGLSCAGTIPCP
jgi:hypothetical protein